MVKIERMSQEKEKCKSASVRLMRATLYAVESGHQYDWASGARMRLQAGYAI